jgi:DNA/RNA-binding domain of Phe-tRNA-synthetase-like protein
MHFSHSDELWRDFPQLAPGVLLAEGITLDRGDVDARISTLTLSAQARIASASESELPEIHAWRRAFAKMGLKPTQYRCASEALLRRLRKEGSLPSLHPLIDLCNAASMAFAVPVAVFDVAKIEGSLEVRQATGAETYQTFSGEVEKPEPGEVIFADQAGNAHARRWTNRQSGLSAVRDETRAVLIVAEALHDTAAADIARLTTALAEAIATTWSTSPTSALLSRLAPRFAF